MCEIGDFSAFSKPKQLFAYFGVDPSVNESGHFKGTDNKMSKRGSKIARRVLYAIALAPVRVNRNGIAVNPVLYEYYQKKKESKPKKSSSWNNYAQDFRYCICVIRDNKPFVLKTPVEHKLKYQNIHKAA